MDIKEPLKTMVPEMRLLAFDFAFYLSLSCCVLSSSRRALSCLVAAKPWSAPSGTSGGVIARYILARHLATQPTFALDISWRKPRMTVVGAGDITRSSLSPALFQKLPPACTLCEELECSCLCVILRVERSHSQLSPPRVSPDAPPSPAPDSRVTSVSAGHRIATERAWRYAVSTGASQSKRVGQYRGSQDLDPHSGRF
eukprot:476653-Rhodomonas_salina.4